MIGGNLKDFLESFTYQSAFFKFHGEIFFTDGIVDDENGYRFFICRWDGSNDLAEYVFEYTGCSKSDCIDAFCHAPIWNGKSLYDVESEVTWLD